MKTKLRIALGALLGIALFVVTLPISSAAPPPPIPVVASSPDHQERGERRHVKQGEEVGKRVKQLQKFNKNVRKALAEFEKNEKRNGHKPKHDESFSVTLDPAGGPPSSAALKMASSVASTFRKASFNSQDPDYSGYGVEMIFIPTYSVPSEWQGTVIFNEFDPSGAYLSQYVADVAMVPDPTNTFWDVYEEVSYQDGEAYLQYGSPYFEFGTPRDNQDSGALQPVISGIKKPDYVKAGLVPTPQGWRGTPHFGIPPTPKMKWVMKCTTIGSAGVAVRCGIGSFFLGGAPYLPCQGAGSAGVFTVCVLVAIFGS